jgi:hypothetical protein
LSYYDNIHLLIAAKKFRLVDTLTLFKQVEALYTLRNLVMVESSANADVSACKHELITQLTDDKLLTRIIKLVE